MTPAQARALMRERKRITRRKLVETAAVKAKADARARRLLEMVEQGTSYEDIAAQLGIRVTSVRGAVRAARKRLGA